MGPVTDSLSLKHPACSRRAGAKKKMTVCRSGSPGNTDPKARIPRKGSVEMKAVWILLSIVSNWSSVLLGGSVARLGVISHRA